MKRFGLAALAALALALGFGESKAQANFVLQYKYCGHLNLRFSLPSFYFGWYCKPACSHDCGVQWGWGCHHGGGHGGHHAYAGDYSAGAYAYQPMAMPYSGMAYGNMYYGSSNMAYYSPYGNGYAPSYGYASNYGYGAGFGYGAGYAAAPVMATPVGPVAPYASNLNYVGY